MDLAALQIFKAVAEQGGVVKAAASLHRVQSNVTTRVKQLEERLGAKLFHRRGRRLELSAEGRVLLGYADQMLRLSREALAAVRGSAPQGTLRVGALESTAAARLPPLLARFHATYPEVCLELVTGTSGALVRRVHEAEIEAAFVAEPFAAANLATEHVFTEELVLIVPPSYPSFSDPRALGSRPVFAFSTGCSYRRRLEAWLGRFNIVPERVLEYASYHAIVACVAAGGGIAVVPRSVLSVVNVDSEIQTHALPPNIAVARTFLVWRPGHQSSAFDALRREAAMLAARRNERAAKPRPGRSRRSNRRAPA